MRRADLALVHPLPNPIHMTLEVQLAIASLRSNRLSLNPCLAQIRLLQGSAAGDRQAMEAAAASARADREKLTADLAAARADLEQSHRDLEQSKDEISGLRVDMAALQAEHQAKVQGLMAQIAGLEADVRRAQQQGQGDAATAAKQVCSDLTICTP